MRPRHWAIASNSLRAQHYAFRARRWSSNGSTVERRFIKWTAHETYFQKAPMLRVGKVA